MGGHPPTTQSTFAYTVLTRSLRGAYADNREPILKPLNQHLVNPIPKPIPKPVALALHVALVVIVVTGAVTVEVAVGKTAYNRGRGRRKKQ